LDSYHPVPVLRERLSQSTAEDDVTGDEVGLGTRVGVAAVPEQPATRLATRTKDSHTTGLAEGGLANAISISPASG